MRRKKAGVLKSVSLLKKTSLELGESEESGLDLGGSGVLESENFIDNGILACENFLARLPL